MRRLQSPIHNASRLLGALVVCAGMLAAAQSTQQRLLPSTNSGPGFRIAGVLVNSVTGEPLRRATVQALAESDSHAVAACSTDNDGHFSLDGLLAAKYQLTASKRGFRTASYDEHDEFATSIVTGPGQDTTHLQFKLMPGAVLRGVVTADDGEPVARARIMLFKHPKHPAAGERTVQVDATMTDDTGAYEMSGIAAGEYFLAVVAEPWYAVHEGPAAKRNAALDVAFPVTYFDSTTEEQAAAPLLLAGGVREEANISLHAVPALHLTIAVPRKPDGSIARPELQQTIFGNVVSAESSGFLDALQTGSVEMSGIAPGRYELTQGDPPRIVELNLDSSQQVDANAGSVANAIGGVLRMAWGQPVPDQVTLSLTRADSGSGQTMYAAEATRGRFKFDAVPPGEWALSATSGDKALPVLSVGTGGAQHAGNTVTLRERTPALVVTLSNANTRVEGFALQDGKACAGAMVVLLPKNPAAWKALTRRDQSNSDGSFALLGVAPGEYTAIAIEDGWPLDWTSPAAMARYLPGGASVTVSDKSGATFRLSSPVPVQTR